MKDVHDIVVCVVDYGTFISVADKLAETCAKVYYHSPIDREFRDVRDCCKGDGLGAAVRCDDYDEPEIYDEVDLWVFPDIGHAGLQRRLRREGKAVWGSMGADEFELYRTRFIALLKEMGLPVIHHQKVTGVDQLARHLKGVKNKWVKVNRYRANMETWFHLDYDHSRGELDRLRVDFGGLQDKAVFVVQDVIETDIEIGYDGWSVDGQFPDSSFQGYEKKNELYLGSLLEYDELPESVRQVNDALAPMLEERGYRNAIATEIRQTADSFYFIDPTLRWPGQTGEQLLETCTNLADVIWHGANGESIKPKWAAKVAAATTLHVTGCQKGDGWKVLRIPEELRRWVKLYHYCEADGLYHFPPYMGLDEVGVVLGMGADVETAVDELKDHLELFGDEPVTAHLDGFVDLVDAIQKAQKEGMKFTDKKLPTPAELVSA